VRRAADARLAGWSLGNQVGKPICLELYIVLRLGDRHPRRAHRWHRGLPAVHEIARGRRTGQARTARFLLGEGVGVEVLGGERRPRAIEDARMR
jgi:hypothetical protein